MLEFTFDDLMRIRSWHFMTRQHHELVPRSVAIVQVCFFFYNLHCDVVQLQFNGGQKHCSITVL